MRLSRHVGENGAFVCPPPDSLQPTQGSLPCGMLDSQPPLQLLATFSYFAILPNTVSGAGDAVRAADDDMRVVDDVRRDVRVSVPRSTRCGLAAGFGASTVTGGSVAAEPVGTCDTAGLLSNTADTTTMADDATKLDDNLMRRVLPRPERWSRPMNDNRHPWTNNLRLRQCPAHDTSSSSCQLSDVRAVVTTYGAG